MDAWGEAQGIAGTNITFMGDPNSVMVENLGVELTHLDRAPSSAREEPSVSACTSTMESSRHSTSRKVRLIQPEMISQKFAASIT